MNRQKGDILMEALIGMLIVSIVGMGSAYVASRSLVAQRYSNAQAAAVSQMRSLLQTQGTALCSTSSTITIAGQSLAVTPTCASITSSVSINGTTLDLTSTNATQTISLAITSASLFGGAGTIVVGQ